MALKYSEDLRNAQLDEITDAIGSGGVLRIYDGAPPAGPDTAVTTQNVLAELTLGTPFADPASGGVLTANAISDDTSANATGTATWFRISTSGGTAVIDGTVGTSNADLIVDSTSFVAGGLVEITSLTITAGNA